MFTQSGAVMLQNIGAHISLIKINDNWVLITGYCDPTKWVVVPIYVLPLYSYYIFIGFENIRQSEAYLNKKCI